MGTWDDGLYDNDSALDELWSFVKIEGEEPDAVRLAARIGLLAWFNPVSVTHGTEGLVARVEALSEAERQRLPEATREALDALLKDPEAATEARSRSKAAYAAIDALVDPRAVRDADPRRRVSADFGRADL